MLLLFTFKDMWFTFLLKWFVWFLDDFLSKNLTYRSASLYHCWWNWMRILILYYYSTLSVSYSDSQSQLLKKGYLSSHQIYCLIAWLTSLHNLILVFWNSKPAITSQNLKGFYTICGKSLMKTKIKYDFQNFWAENVF